MAIGNNQQQNTIKSLPSSSSSSSSSVTLPWEIIFEILSRLPVESLLRCKSVCKSWRSLISDPHFIKYHLTLSTTNHHYTHHRLLVSAYVPDLRTCSLSDVMYDHHLINPLEVDYPMKNLGKIVSIVGSCNGLICITMNPDNVLIWNPSTRKSIHLPGRPRCAAGFVVRGFGYVESSDDYKVVEITFSSLQDTDDNVVMIYSSKNGNWKEIGGFPHSIWFRNSDVFLNGALHWLATNDIDSWIIVSLDLAKETYGQVLLPLDDYEVDVDLMFGILGDCFCVLCEYSRSSRFYADVWVMKVYGVKDSWFKLASIPYDLVIGLEQFHWGDRLSTPLCVSDDGKILLQLDSSLIVFDTKDDSALKIPKFYACYKACTFVESLVSPGGPENLI